MKSARVSGGGVALAVAVGLSCASGASAAVYNINVNTVPGSVHHMIGTTDPTNGTYSTGIDIGNSASYGGNVRKGWAQFDIPTLPPGESVVSLVLNTHCVALTSNAPGALVDYTSDDGWNPIIGVGIYPTQSAYNASPSTEQEIAGIGGFVPGDYHTDITSFLLQPGEGPGNPLSMAINYYGGGTRGALLGYDNVLWPNDPAAVTLTLTTEVPEPTTLGLLSAVGALFLRRR